jgi:hypothetical protein
MKKLLITTIIITVFLAAFVSAGASDVVMKAYQEEGKPRVMNFVSSKKELNEAFGAYNMISAISSDPVKYGQNKALETACSAGSGDMKEACGKLSQIRTAYTTISGLQNMGAIGGACGVGGSLVSGLGDACSKYQAVYGQAQQYAGIVKDPSGAAKEATTQQLNMLKQKMYTLLAEQLLPQEAKEAFRYAQKARGYADAMAKTPSSKVKNNVKSPSTVGATSGKNYNIPRKYSDAKACAIGMNFNTKIKDPSKGTQITDITNCMVDTKGKETALGKYSFKTVYLGQRFVVPDKPAPFRYNFTSIDGTVMLKRLNGFTYFTAAGPDTVIRTNDNGWSSDQEKKSKTDYDNQLTNLMGNSYIVFNGSTIFQADLTIGKSFAFIEYDNGKLKTTSWKPAKGSAKITLLEKTYDVPFGSRVVYNGSDVVVDMGNARSKTFDIIEGFGENAKKIGTVKQTSDKKVEVRADPAGGYRIKGMAEFTSVTGAKLYIMGGEVRYKNDNDFSISGYKTGGLGVAYEKGNKIFYAGADEGWTRITVRDGNCDKGNVGNTEKRIDYCKTKDSMVVRAGSDKGSVNIR